MQNAKVTAAIALRANRRLLSALAILIVSPLFAGAASSVQAFRPDEKEPGYFSAELRLPAGRDARPAARAADLEIILRDVSFSMAGAALPVPPSDAPERVLIDFDAFPHPALKLASGQAPPPASYDGGTDMGAAFEAAAKHLHTKKFEHARIVVLSDGRDSCGAPDPKDWLAPLLPLGPRKVSVVFAKADARMARAFENFNRPPAGQFANVSVSTGAGVIDLANSFQAQAGPPLPPLGKEGKTGGGVRIFGRFNAASGSVRVSYVSPDGSVAVPIDYVLDFQPDPKNNDLPRLWARARLADLELEQSLEMDPLKRKDLQASARKLAQEYHLFSPRASFHAQESEAERGLLDSAAPRPGEASVLPQPVSAEDRLMTEGKSKDALASARRNLRYEWLIKNGFEAEAEKVIEKILRPACAASAFQPGERLFTWSFALHVWHGRYSRAADVVHEMTLSPGRSRAGDLQDLWNVQQIAFSPDVAAEFVVPQRKAWKESAAARTAGMKLAEVILQRANVGVAEIALAGACALPAAVNGEGEERKQGVRMLERIFKALKTLHAPAAAEWLCNNYANLRWAGDPTDADASHPLRENLAASVAAAQALGERFLTRGLPLIHKFHGWDDLTREQQLELLRPVTRLLEIIPFAGPLPREGLGFPPLLTKDDWNALDRVPTPAEWLGWQAQVRRTLFDAAE